MRRSHGAAAVAAACVTIGLAGVPSSALAARDCGRIGFTPNSGDGVFDIRATGIGCPTARRVARAVRPLGIVNGPYTYRQSGFSCRGTFDDRGLPAVRYRCTRKRARIIFTRT